MARGWVRRRKVAAAAFVVALPLGACTAPDPLVVGGRVPDYAAADLDGNEVRLRDLRGQVVLLNIWATWCYPCRREMPGLEELHRELGGRGLTVVAASIDGPGSAGDIGEFLEELGLTMQVLHDARADVSRAFSTRGVPETFLIGVDGTLRHHWIGRIDARSESVRGPVRAAMTDLAR
jgi:peroxiredoxin